LSTDLLVGKNGRCYVRGRDRDWPWARIVIENALGRVLDADEVVHHVNGDPSDDRLANLRVLTRREHMEAHRPELIEANRRQVEVHCANCGLPFMRAPSGLRGRAHYCSRACGYAAMRVTVCRWGHPRTPETTHVRKNGRSECLVCLRLRSRRIRARQKAAA
jgi:hypothetical protein